MYGNYLMSHNVGPEVRLLLERIFENALESPLCLSFRKPVGERAWPLLERIFETALKRGENDNLLQRIFEMQWREGENGNVFLLS